MKIKLSKKTKTFLWVATALATSTAATTLLTSCSTANQNVINDIGGYDKEYGINDVTYARMEEDFKALYQSQLDDKKIAGEIDDATYNLQLTTFQNKLNSLHTSLYNSDENKTLSYTIRTNVLRDYARNNYGIRLSRQSNVSLPVAISGIKGSIINSVLLLCKEYKIADTNKYRENAEAEFEKLYTEAKSKYAEDDVVSIVQYIQNGMVSCFANINKELDVLITQQQLKDFISKYQIRVKDDISKDYYWDKLFSKYGGEGGKEISVEDFNSIFTMTYEETDPQSSSSSYFSTSKKTVEFKDDMIIGYTLKPILVEMNGDAYTNTYSINVDYTLVNNNYKDDEKVAELTVHSSQLKDKSVYEDENITIFDLNKSSEKREYTNYVLPITEEYEKEQINKTYFNNQDFKFSWSKSEEYGYDDFWTEPNENGEYKGKLNIFGLATSGMMINGKLLSDILYEAGKISLSGGSVSLSGKAKTKGEDSNQWKLIIDNEEVDKNAIEWKLISTTTEKELPDSIKINDGFVSWTDKIEAKTYNFSVLAIYKETKIQSPLITLTISSSEQSENTGNLNYAIKNMLYDENTIDQGLLDFVKNVDFSLDYTEKDYDAVKDGKKGEILINNIIIGYKNSKNTFKISNSATKQAISDAINNDSGVTKRFSDSLWTHIKLNYDSANGIYDEINKLSTKLKDINDELTGLLVSLCAISASITLFYLTTLVLNLIIICRDKAKKNKKHTITILIALFFIVSLGILIPTAISLGNKNSEINNNLGTIKNDSKEAQFSINLKNDYSYFYSNNDGSIVPDKSEFDKLSLSKVKKLKLYYSTYKNKETEEDKKTQSQKDYEEFLKLGKEDKNLNSYLDDYSEGLIIAGIVVASLLSIAMLLVITRNTIVSIQVKTILCRDIITFAVLIVSALCAVWIFCSTIR